MNYWKPRRNFKYYKAVTSFVQGKTILDVGGGVLLGCQFLSQFPNYDRTSIELPRKSEHNIPNVRVIQEDFLTWEIDKQYDTVLCLQVLEHVENPKKFAEKLFLCGDNIIISVPYLWRKGRCKDHLHDPVDEAKLRSWTGKEPMKQVIVEDNKMKRLVAIWQQHQHK